MLDYLTPELLQEALRCVDAKRATEDLLAMPERKFRLLLNQAWEVAYRENIFCGLRQQAGELPGSPSVPMGVLGSALAIVSVGSRRGLAPPSGVLRRVRRELLTSAKEYGAAVKGKLKSIR